MPSRPIAFWPPENAFCVFSGQTPCSPVNVVGKLDGEPKGSAKVESHSCATVRLATGPHSAPVRPWAASARNTHAQGGDAAVHRNQLSSPPRATCESGGMAQLRNYAIQHIGVPVARTPSRVVSP
ncbi:MAG: hypothetical protein FJ272_17360 [Planctomycetes bacterium]|nr:hypothetical protein [Planctomycetota bacterium]